MKKRIKIIAVMLAAVMLGTAVYGDIDTVIASSAEEGADKPDSEKTPEELAKEAYEKEIQAVHELPVQSNEVKGWPKGEGTYGDAAIVMDADSGAILYAKNIDKAEYPASITKVLTALTAYQYADMSEKVTITPEALSCLGSGYASIGLKAGNVITMEQAIYAMLLASANEAAYAVGETVAQSQGEDYEWFLEQMNKMCRKLGGKNSNFINTNGVFEKEHYTTARDMALIGCELFKYPEFLEVCQTQQYVIPASATVEEHVFQQKHQMLIQGNKEFYEYAVAGKTGYTTEAKNTLITFADNGERRLVCVILGTYGGHSYSDTKELLEYGFHEFEKCSIKEEDVQDEFKKISEDACVVLPKGVSFEDLDCVITPSKKTYATAEYFYKDIPVGKFEVTLSDDYENKPKVTDVQTESEEKPEKKEGFKAFVSFGIAAAAVVCAGVVVFAVWVNRARKKRRRKRRRRR